MGQRGLLLAGLLAGLLARDAADAADPALSMLDALFQDADVSVPLVVNVGLLGFDGEPRAQLPHTPPRVARPARHPL